jgi:hypothetical protein
MNFVHAISFSLRVSFGGNRSPATVTGGSTAAQSIVAAVQRKKIYCKANPYQ